MSEAQAKPKIVSLDGSEARTPDGAYTEVIGCLERALEQAREGKIAAVALVMVRPNRDIDTAVSKNDMGRHMMVAGCAYLMNDLIHDTVGE